jgi:hypothetical protein
MSRQRDIHAAVMFNRGAIAHFEDLALDLMSRHQVELDVVEAHKLADEYEATWELKLQLEELVKRATR